MHRVDMAGDTPLHLACASGNVPAIRALILAGASVHARNRAGLTPLDLLTDRDVARVVEPQLVRAPDQCPDHPDDAIVAVCLWVLLIGPTIGVIVAAAWENF